MILSASLDFGGQLITFSGFRRSVLILPKAQLDSYLSIWLGSPL